MLQVLAREERLKQENEAKQAAVACVKEESKRQLAEAVALADESKRQMEAAAERLQVQFKSLPFQLE